MTISSSFVFNHNHPWPTFLGRISMRISSGSVLWMLCVNYCELIRSFGHFSGQFCWSVKSSGHKVTLSSEREEKRFWGKGLEGMIMSLSIFNNRGISLFSSSPLLFHFLILDWTMDFRPFGGSADPESSAESA